MSPAAPRVEIYALLDADGTVRYVGRSVNARARASSHRRDVARYPDDDRPVATWLRSLDASPAARVLARVVASQASAAEETWIRRLRRDPAARLLNLRPYEPLAHLPGVDPAVLKRVRWSVARSVTKERRARVSAALQGHAVSPATRQRIALAHAGRPKSPEHRAAIAVGVRRALARRRAEPSSRGI
ncbi:hypothetical protein SAMN05216489_01878 [Streptomyces sp. 3213]|uniref:GIY-YIG nuclease family protein n=1 Tax=Streptomyces sp. 3213.3 TaxID=1855348 RepID=UPI000899A1D8|nr:GIY-YIG nuclease family protein [Streptomyces sp. 3213.3]SEC88544.1 hypothetical protein SAMN05216489_01878 [Streptomyces sp. 3213] [Streptomyces sp. 3213.3]